MNDDDEIMLKHRYKVIILLVCTRQINKYTNKTQLKQKKLTKLIGNNKKDIIKMIII